MLRRQFKKLGPALTLLLVLSQGLSLVHATGHYLEAGDTDCQVCTLQHQFHSVTLDTKPFAAEFVAQAAPAVAEFRTCHSTFLTDKAIRAPPATPPYLG